MTAKSLEAWYAALTVGGRLTPERSYAREQKYYGDPSRAVKFQGEKSMQRDIDEVEVLLDLWAEWMRKPEPVEGVKVASGFIKSAGCDSEELYEAHDNDQAERVNACFDSLAPVYKDAIMRRYKLGSHVWRFNQSVTFEDAKIMMRVKLVTKGLL